MATTVRSGAIYGIGVYGVARYGKSNVAYTPDGLQAVATSDSGVVISGDANHVVVSLVSPAAVGSVGVVGVAITNVSGVSATAYLNAAVTLSLGCKFSISGVFATGNIGNVTITTVVFNYNAVAALYDRNRTVYVEARSTAKERTVMVMKDNRTVYIEGRSTTATRTSSVDELPRRIYTYRKPSSSDRSVLVA